MRWNISVLAILAANKMSFDIQPVKCLFYAACNAILIHAKSLHELIHLSLQESLPILTYAIGALAQSAHQLHELNVCWNT